MSGPETSAAPSNVSAEADVARLTELACLLEVNAPKPGNVSPGLDFQDSRYEDFVASAAAIAQPMAAAGRQPVGITVRLAIEATARATSSNTNLGIVLLFAPLARAALLNPRDDWRATSPSSLRQSLRSVLDDTTLDDARNVYAAIRHAAPGGLGNVEQQDVSQEPTMTLVEAMQLAADRDGIANEYATAFQMTFGTGVIALERAKRDGLSWNDAVVETFLTVLAAAPDTHIARRGGSELAADVSRRAATVLAAGGVRTEEGRVAIRLMDRTLRDPEHLANPGTSADITAAAILVVLLTSRRVRR